MEHFKFGTGNEGKKIEDDFNAEVQKNKEGKDETASAEREQKFANIQTGDTVAYKSSPTGKLEQGYTVSEKNESDKTITLTKDVAPGQTYTAETTATLHLDEMDKIVDFVHLKKVE